MSLEYFYGAIPEPSPDDPDAQLIHIKSETLKTVIALDMYRCGGCNRMHLGRLQVLTKGPEIKPGDDFDTIHQEGTLVQDPDDPNNYLII